jgi:LPS O-antigen subunit length determinant protein (WzzB/FepE family)
MRIEEPRRLFQRHQLRRSPFSGAMIVATFVVAGFAAGAALLFVLPPDDQSQLFVAAIAPVALSFTFFRTRT